jgi:hypothetical protein
MARTSEKWHVYGHSVQSHNIKKKRSFTENRADFATINSTHMALEDVNSIILYSMVAF